MTAGISERPITPAQVKSIHVAAGRLGLDDDEYRAILADWNVATCKDLTRREASDLLRRLGRPLPNAPGSKPRSPTRRPIARPADPPDPSDEDGVPRIATAGQRGLVEELRAEVAWDAADGFERWLRRSLGISRIRTAKEASMAIDGLRGLKAHGHGAPP